MGGSGGTAASARSALASRGSIGGIVASAASATASMWSIGGTAASAASAAAIATAGATGPGSRNGHGPLCPCAGAAAAQPRTSAKRLQAPIIVARLIRLSCSDARPGGQHRLDAGQHVLGFHPLRDEQQLLASPPSPQPFLPQQRHL